jgi:cell division protein FtsI/penicillin-binding protein 2
MRRAVLLAGGALLAGAGLFMSSPADSESPPKASVPGAPLIPSKATPDEVAKFESLAEDSVQHATVDLQLDKMELVDGHYVAPLRDGRKATLTLDPDLQKLAEKLLDESRAPRGAIVAMTPDGKILAFAGRRTEENKGGKQGTFDYHLATEVWAPAASIFKLVTASALLVNGYNADDKVCFHGGVRSVMESNLADSKNDYACETLGFGVAHSNNAILGKLAYQKLEPTKLDHAARDLGWTMAPSSLGVKATCGELDLPKTKDLEFAKAAAGFKGAKLSVLGGALLGATFAAGGQQPAPRIIESIDGKSFATTKPKRVLPEPIAKTVGSMMKETCISGSAAKTFRKRRVEVAGKTGTLTTTKPFYMEHSWFVGFAPVDQPEVVVSVLLGNPESWHLRGHEAAKRMIDRATRRAGDREEAPKQAPPKKAKKSTKSSARASKRRK